MHGDRRLLIVDELAGIVGAEQEGEVDGTTIAAIAHANIGKDVHSINTTGGTGYYTSTTAEPDAPISRSGSGARRASIIEG